MIDYVSLYTQINIPKGNFSPLTWALIHGEKGSFFFKKMRTIKIKLSLTMNTLTPYPTKAPVRSSMPTKRKFRTAYSKNIRRSGKRKRLHRVTLTAAVRHSSTAQRTSRRGLRQRIKAEAATPSVPRRRKKETAPDITEAEIIKDLTEKEVQSNKPS